MNTKNYFLHCALLLIICLIYSCSGFEKIGSNLGGGVASKSKEIGTNLVDGALTRVSSGTEKELLKHLLDSMILNAGLSANKQVISLRDSILNDITNAKLNRLISEAMKNAVGDSTKAKLAALRNELIGANTRIQLAALRNELLGNETNSKVQKIVHDAMAALLNDSVSIKLGLVRDTLLSDKTNRMLKAIIDTAMLGIADKLRDAINPQIKENLGFIKKYATELLTTIALLAAGIIVLVWRNRQKYLKAVTLLTSNIQNIPDQHVYDQLTAKIKTDAVKSGIEPTLRTVLKDNGLLGSESWEKMKKVNQL